jgi:hypothetical protein
MVLRYSRLILDKRLSEREETREHQQAYYPQRRDRAGLVARGPGAH